MHFLPCHVAEWFSRLRKVVCKRVKMVFAVVNYIFTQCEGGFADVNCVFQVMEGGFVGCE